MTQPVLANQGRDGRTYTWPPTPPHEFEVGSVTKFIGAIAKPGLIYWSANEVADFAIRNRVKWERLDYRDAYDLLKRAPWRNRDAKADIGTVAHAAIEAHIAGKPLPPLDESNEGYANAGLKFLSKWQVKVVHSEVTVFSRTHGYAGTLDIVAELPSYGLAVVDFKTGKKPYPEVGLQLAAYANADFIGTGDGVELPMPKVRVGMVVTLRPNGEYEAQLVDIGDPQFEAFLHAKSVYEWSQTNHRVIGQALDVPGEGVEQQGEEDIAA